MTACEVYPGVWVGDLTSAHYFQGPKLCVRDQPGDYLFKHQEDRQIHWVYGKPPIEVFETAAEWIDYQLSKGRAVLVHCSGGLHRSAAAVVYWLIHRRGLSLEQAYQMVRAWRPEIEPRPRWLSGESI